MKITIFILCYNESKIIRQTIYHYKTLLPSAEIIIYDNASTDNSDIIATELGCKVNKWDTKGKLNEHYLSALKNYCWRYVTSGWIIICDMDEWLCVKENDLINEENNGTSILKVRGYNIIGNSKLNDLSDINLHDLHHGVYFQMESKNICFNREKIKLMNYSHGSHTCNPIGEIKFSEKEYILKHMDILGLQYKLWKQQVRFERSVEMRKLGFAIHYTNNIKKIVDDYNKSALSKQNIHRLLINYHVN